jgi:hypothetical protein
VPGRYSHSESFTGTESAIQTFPGSGLRRLLTWRPGAEEMHSGTQRPGRGGSGVVWTVTGVRLPSIVIAYESGFVTPA